MWIAWLSWRSPRGLSRCASSARMTLRSGPCRCDERMTEVWNRLMSPTRPMMIAAVKRADPVIAVTEVRCDHHLSGGVAELLAGCVKHTDLVEE